MSGKIRQIQSGILAHYSLIPVFIIKSDITMTVNKVVFQIFDNFVELFFMA